jgi:P-type Ca2+ transporter type 2C
VATAPLFGPDSQDWYRLPADDAVLLLAGRREGLTPDEVEARLHRFGPNRLERRKGPSPLILFLRQFQSPLVYVLLGAAIVTALVHSYEDTVVIMVVVIANSLIGYFQESKAAAAMEALLRMTAPTATVVRGGHHQEVEVWQLVPGDVVVLAGGDRVPADLRLMEAHNLQADEAALTGESVPAAKSTLPVQEADLPPADQTNIAFAGTTVTTGRGVGIVVATGMHTELGKISQQVTGVEEVATPLQERLQAFSRFLGVAVLILVAIVFLLGVLVGFGVFEMFLTAITLAVSAIPEGLPATVTIILAIGTRRMAERNAIIRKLPAVETLGTADFICTDKTGTLTRNEMTVRVIHAGDEEYEVSGNGYYPEGEVTLHGRLVEAGEHPALEMLLNVAVLANDSRMTGSGEDRHPLGDPTEGALLVAAEKAGLSPHRLHATHHRVAEIPFESELQYMATLHRFGEDTLLLVKGAPGRVLEMCTSMLTDSGRAPLNREKVLQEIQQLAEQGYRVLAMAYRPVKSSSLNTEDVGHDLVFAGLVGMIDPPRPEVAQAVRDAESAGVRVAMVTGDHRQTATAIASQLGILRPHGRVMTGKEVEELTNDQLVDVVERVDVYARAAPSHKLRIVSALQSRGHIVAVTGDGVNDAPALRAADIGVAMGITGTDVSKETADMVLADDNFATILSAIEEGRVVFENIRKAVFFLLSTNAGEVLTILLALLVGLPLPLVPVQILWMNLVTDSAPVIALGFEPGEREYLRRPPRHPKSEMLSRTLVWRIGWVSVLMAVGTLGLFTLELRTGVGLTEARTVAFTTLVFFQLFNALNARSETHSVFSQGLLTNRVMVWGLLLGVLLQLLVIYLPAAQSPLDTAPISPTNWGLVVGVSASVLVLVELEKLLLRRR